MSNEMIPYEKKLADLRSVLIRSKGEIMKALPNYLDSERMFRLYLTCCQITPRIADCESMSILGAVMTAAQLGLSLERVMGEAYLIPRRNRHLGGAWGCNFQIGYKGLRKLAKQGDPDIRDIYAVPVYQNDVFDFEYGDTPKITHKPARKNRGDIVNAYARAIWKDGYTRCWVIGPEDVERARKSSDAYTRAEGQHTNDSPWHTDPDAMWMKTALLRLCRQMPLAADSPLAHVVEAEENTTDGRALLQKIRGESPDVLLMPPEMPSNGSGEPEPPQPKSTLDRVVEQVQAQPQQRKRRAAPAEQSPPVPAPAPAAPDAPPVQSAVQILAADPRQQDLPLQPSMREMGDDSYDRR